MNKIEFEAPARGGQLCLGSTLGRNPATVTISTDPHESAKSVVSRLATRIEETWGAGWAMGACAIESTLYLPMGTYSLAGSELGLGIPSAPHSLTCVYDEQRNVLTANWENPTQPFDSVKINFNWEWPIGRVYPVRVDGSPRSLEVDLAVTPIDLNDAIVWIVGYHKSVPSNASIIQITQNGRCQEELFGAPHTAGIPPNWVPWTGEGSKITFEQMVREDRVLTRQDQFIAVDRAQFKPYWLKTRSLNLDSEGGIWRKFIGLISGHTYRISARLNVKENDTGGREEWSASFHAAATDEDFSTEQLSGKATLPDGSFGSEAGRFAFYTHGKDTDGQFTTSTTTDITLPNGRDTIIAWLRVSGKTPPDGVGFDWIRLEDVTQTSTREE